MEPGKKLECFFVICILGLLTFIICKLEHFQSKFTNLFPFQSQRPSKVLSRYIQENASFTGLLFESGAGLSMARIVVWPDRPPCKNDRVALCINVGVRWSVSFSARFGFTTNVLSYLGEHTL